jgi:hypothetical protein
MAQQFLGTSSLQDTIQAAVDLLLDQMHQLDGFDEALRAAERSRQEHARIRRIGKAND